MKRAILAFVLFAAVFGIAANGSAGDVDLASAEKAVFAGGCFWCMQPPFDYAQGVISTLVGYAGGAEINPTYEQVSAGETGHREAIEVTYDPTKIS